MAFQTAPAWMENSDQHHAVIYRQLVRGLTNSASGVVGSSALAVTEKSGTADMSVDVAAGGALIPSTRSAHQGSYYAYNDGVLNVPITASHPTNDRIDRILIQVRDSAQDVALTQDDMTILVVEGTPASVPVLPSITVDDWIELARVLVPAAATSITNAEITDVRQVMEDPYATPAADAQYTAVTPVSAYSITFRFHRLGAMGFMQVSATRTGANSGANTGALIATAGPGARSQGSAPIWTQSLTLRSASAGLTTARCWYDPGTGQISAAWDQTWVTGANVNFNGAVLLDVAT